VPPLPDGDAAAAALPVAAERPGHDPGHDRLAPPGGPAPVRLTDEDPPELDALLAGGGLRDVLDQLPAVIGIFTGPELRVAYANPGYAALAGGRQLLGRPVAEVFGEPEHARFLALLHDTLRSGRPAQEREWGGIVADRATGEHSPVWFDFAYVPLRAPGGEPVGVIVHATDVTRLVGARRTASESERRLRLLTEGGVVGVIVADEDRILEANDAFLDLVGRDRAELEAGTLSWVRMTPPEYQRASAAAVARVREVGRGEPFEKDYLRPDGSRVPVLVATVRLDADPYRALTVVIDQSARRAAEEERERLLTSERAARHDAEVTAERIARLQRATAALGAALSPAEVGEATVTHAVEALGADAGSLGLVDDGDIVLVHDRGYRVEDVERWRRFSVDGPGPLAEAVRTGAPVLVDRVEAWERWPEVARTIRRFEALAAVPLVAGGRVLGAIALSFAAPRWLSTADHAFLLALANQAAQGLDRARLYEQRAYVARTLQAGLLPERLAQAPGLEVAVRYHSIADGGQVGGDFYDFFDVSEDRWIAAIGDVSGKGSPAAVLTGLARHTLRAIATRGEPPAAMLAFVNEALRRQSSASAFCTIACAAVDRAPDGFALRLASGGHPYPLLVRAGATEVEEIAVRGTLLGVEPDPPLEEVALALRPGDTLLLRTDGTEDARGPGGDRFGEDRLRAALGAAVAAGGGAEAVAAAVDAEVAEHEAGRRRDDRAILVLRVSP
jgi:PAS domain S-box-containing protein